MAFNKGRSDSENPTDANQANPGNDVKVNPDAAIQTEQETDSTWLLIPKVVEVDGINYGPGEVKVATEDVEKVVKNHPEISKIKEPENEHHGAKPMPKDLNGVDYV